MAGDWIKIEHVTPDKPEVGLIAERLDIDPDAVVGKLIRLWIWADQQSLDGHAVSVTNSTLDRVTFAPGFAQALIDAGWLERHGNSVTFPNFDRHNGQTAKNRGLANKRKAAQRAKVTHGSRECHDESVTKMGQEQGPEKRREENIDSLSREGVGDLSPTWEQVEQAASNMMVPTNIAERFYDDMEACGWLDAKSRPIRNFQHALKAWATRYQDNEARKQHGGGSRPNGSRVDRNAGTSNAGRASEYRNV